MIGLVVVVGLYAILGHYASPKLAQLQSSEGCASSAPQLSILMIGNSYTYTNDLPTLTESVLCGSGMASNVRVDAMTAGGAALPHWDNAKTRKHLAGHSVVVFQDQSEIPGFGADDPQFVASQNAVDHLGAAATAARTHVVLFETWGHENGGTDSDYTDMQSALGDGYSAYLASLHAGPARDAETSAVGDAWQWVYDHDPDVFSALYLPDGSHPSVAGSYLAALVLAETISKQKLPARPWVPDEVSAHQADVLQAAARTV